MTTVEMLAAMGIIAVWAVFRYIGLNESKEKLPLRKLAVCNKDGSPVALPEEGSLKIQQISDPLILMEKSKHCGWCTKRYEEAYRYLLMGAVWQITKVGKRRASYQVFVSIYDGRWELKAKGNKSVKPLDFIERHPDYEEWIRGVLPKLAFINQQQEQHFECCYNGDGTLTIKCGGDETIINLYEPPTPELDIDSIIRYARNANE